MLRIQIRSFLELLFPYSLKHNLIAFVFICPTYSHMAYEHACGVFHKACLLLLVQENYVYISLLKAEQGNTHTHSEYKCVMWM